jgi:hypothetical protein
METTVLDMEQLTEKIQAKRLEIDQAQDVVKELNKQLASLELTMMEKLHELGKDSYKSEVGTISIIHRTSFKTPKTPEEKAAFFDYLRAKNMFDALVSVNSQTLNSFCKAELETAIAEGRGLDFKIPGIGEPTVQEIIGFRKAK